jgi:hypothetical protein
MNSSSSSFVCSQQSTDSIFLPICHSSWVCVRRIATPVTVPVHAGYSMVDGIHCRHIYDSRSN